MENNEVKVVNIIGSGTLGVDIHIEKLLEQIDSSITRYDPEMYHGMYIRFSQDSPLVTLYASGKYILTGAKTTSELNSTRDKLLNLFEKIELIGDTDKDDFSIQNIVCTANLGQGIDLNQLSIYLGLESVEYEPEQFPGLVYRPEDHDCVALVFSSGKMVLTGCNSISEAEQAYVEVKQLIEDEIGKSS